MNRRDVDARIVSVAATTAMVVTTDQLAEAGVPRHLVRSRVGGLLTPMCRGVYVIGTPTVALRLRALLAAVPSAAVWRRSAAALHGLVVPPPAEPEAVVVSGRRSRSSIDGVRLAATRWLPDTDVAMVDGLRVTTVARTLCDLSTQLSRPRLSHLVEESLVAQLVSIGELQACLSAWGRRGRPGSGLIRLIDHELLDETPIAASELERRATCLLRGAQMKGWTTQYRPPWYDGVRGVVDLAWPAHNLIVELDGRRWHATTQAQGEDRRRDRLAVAHGWTTLRFGWQEINRRPTAVIEECQAVLAALKSALPPQQRDHNATHA